MRLILHLTSDSEKVLEDVLFVLRGYVYRKSNKRNRLEIKHSSISDEGCSDLPQNEFEFV